MPKFAANLSMMSNEVPFIERFATAANAGFTGVEYLFPYEFPAEEIAAELRKHNLVNVLFNLPAGDWASGERGTTCQPAEKMNFALGWPKQLSIQQFNTKQPHAMAGIVSAYNKCSWRS